MTFKEKLIQEHPEKAKLSESSLEIKCPFLYMYESEKKQHLQLPSEWRKRMRILLESRNARRKE